MDYSENQVIDLGFKLIVTLIPPKDKNIDRGCFVEKNGRLYFVSGKNIVYVNEHFSDSGPEPERLVENTIRFDSENSPEILESEENLCYNEQVNDVL